MPEGLIVKALSGFYYVEEKDSKKIYECRGRGIFRNENVSPYVGDVVEFQVEANDKGYITKLGERKNHMIRPQITNVDYVLLVFSAKKPEFNQSLLDRFLSIIEANDMTPVIILTKMDLVTDKASIERYIDYYESIGYKIFQTSKLELTSFDQLKEVINDHISVLAGQSGVGKSSMLNTINPDFKLQVNDISKALGRGKHTTRHVELFKIFDGLVADTPGFSSLDFKDFDIDDVALSQSFIDYFELSHSCKFRGCLHINEPKCMVKAKLGENPIYDQRYENYKNFYDEIKNQKVIYIKKSK